MRYFFSIIICLLVLNQNLAQSFGGSLSSNTTVCQGNNTGQLSVTGYSGSINRWEYAYNNTGPWTPIVFTSNTYNYTNLLQSTYFRVAVQLTGYPEAMSNTVLVNCTSPSIAGNITSNTFQCINSPVTSTLAGNTGTVLSWEYSTNNWIVTNTITTSNTLIATLSSLTNTTQIRARVQNGVCPVVFSNTLTIFPASLSNGGLISGTQSVCASSNASTLTLSNYTGNIQQWESSASSGGPFNTISSSANTSTISYVNLSQNTWYRVLVKNGTCPDSYSATFSVNVNAPSVGGNIVGTQSVCANTNSGILQLLAQTGQVNQWEYSLNNGLSWSSLSNTTTLHTFSNITSTRVYKATVQNGLCPPTSSALFTVNVNPVPTSTFNVTNVCALTPGSFTNLTAGNNSYVWDFGNGGSANIANPSYSYPTQGTYTVKLVSTTQLGCTDSLKKTITIFPIPSVNYVSADTACFGNTILFTNASSITSGNITQVRFNFGDGSPTSTLSSVNHYFLSDGNYSVYLTATSNLGCKDSVVKLIRIHPKPNSNFSVSNVCKGTPALCNNLSGISNGSLQHFWNFGNSFTSILNSPPYVYPNAGTFTISLISTSNHNCKDTAFKTISINETPAVIFSATNTCLGNPVTFSTSISPSNLSTSLTVNFGDGIFSNSFNPSHIYVSSGTFASSIIAVTDSGCVASAAQNVSIFSKPFANFNFNNVCTADSVKFTNTSSISNGSMSYLWNLSGLASSTLNSPGFLYQSPGTFTVSLIALSNFDCSDTVVKSLTIFEAPKANFNFGNSCDGFPVTFTNTSLVNSGSISHNHWDFGDNSTTTEINPTKNYLNKGSYTVTLITLSTNGCSDTITKTVNVFEGPIADFSVDNHCLNTAAVFANKSILNSGTYLSKWYFGDSDSSFSNSPTHLYAKAGTYKVWLKVSSVNSCKDSIFRFVETFSPPHISAGKDTSINKGFGVLLNATGAQNYNWYPSEGLSNPVIANPFSNPETSTTYIVEGVDVNGCKNSDTLRITINDSFLVIPYNIVTPDGNGKNDTWIVKNIQAYKENHLLIFDQWNQKVYEKENYANEWEGKNSQGEILPDATYYYILRFTNNPKTYSGYITLLRNKK